MIAVVYSGSHIADWRLSNKGKTVASFKTSSINPQFNDEKHILQLLNKNINLIHHAEEVKRVYFFSAGASTAELKNLIRKSMSAFFKFAKISVEHDMLAAAIACCKNSAGIVCICGSGSNAAWYDGKKLKSNNYGLGYILADEGSANWLGRQLIKAFMNETLPENLKKKFEHRYDADRKTILEKVYRLRQPALFLSSFTDFYTENHTDPYIKNKIKQGFELLIDTYLLPLQNEYPGTPVHFTGSIAAIFQEELRETTAATGIEVGNIIREPINNLLTYYSNKN
jgi:glucosamine kinase